MVPRMSYLLLCIGPLKDYFRSLLHNIDEMWFESQGIPLKWYLIMVFDCKSLFPRHIPFGVLFDSLCSQKDVPWKVTVHFGKFPSDTLLKWSKEDDIHSHFTHALKEATYVRTGSTALVTRLQPRDAQQMWDGLRTSV